MRALAQHARAHAEHRGFAAFLTEMAGQGHYGRRIALHLAMAARDLTYITQVLAGPDPELRRAALRAVRTLPVSDEAIPPALHEASTELRIAVYRSIVHARRTELADTLLVEVNERWGAKEAGLLLAACSPSIVAEWLPSLAHAVTAWKTLTRRYPKLVLRCLDDEFATTRRLALRRAVALREAARVEPALVLDLLERHDLGSWAEYLPGNVLGPLFRADLHRTARLLPKQRWMSYESKSALLKRCAEFSDDELLTLVSTRSQADVLRALPIPRRGAIYARMEHGEIAALHLLRLLPNALAVSEARRLREWHSSVWHSSRAHLDDPKIILRITAFLPFAEAEPELRAAAFTGDPRRRDIARTLLLGAAQRSGDRAKAAAVLGELVDRIRNERDPSRAALLEGLAGLRLDPRWAEHLDRLADAAIHARDTSERTREAVRKLADRALNSEPALASWALRSYARLIDRFGADALTRPGPGAVDRRHRRLSARISSRPTLGRVLRRGQEHELLALLARPRDHELTVALARSLGTRLRALPELRRDLRQAVLDGPDEVAGEAAELMLRRIQDKDTQVAALLADDPRAIRFAPVWHNVATRRTDLLPADPREVLVQHDIEPGMPGRWTDRQRDTIGATLAAIVDDRDALVEDRVRALRGLGRIPVHAKLIEHALGGEPVIAEAAIEACGGYPEALPQLLLRIPGPVALAAAAKLCRVRTPSRLRDALAQALFEGRVGARKLAARQLVAQRVPGATDLLLRAWAEPELHPDVRIAVAVALQRLPEDERARSALAEVPGRYASELMIRTLLQAIPEAYAPDHRVALADLVRGLMAAAEGPGVQFRAAKAFAIWVPWYRGGTDAIIEGAVTGDDIDMTVFLSLVRSGVIREEVLTVLRRLLAAENHARVREVAKTLNATVRDEEWKQDRARAAAELLLEHPLHLLEAASMLIYLLPLYVPSTDDVAAQAWVRELSFLADRLTPVLATRIISTHTMHFGWNRSSELMLPAVNALIARGDLTAGVLALGLLNGSSRSPERTEAIEQLRSSPHLDLRRLAWEIEQ